MSLTVCILFFHPNRGGSQMLSENMVSALRKWHWGTVGNVTHVAPLPPSTLPADSTIQNRTVTPSFMTTIISYRRPTAARSGSNTAAANHRNLIRLPLPHPSQPPISSILANVGLLNIRSPNNKSFLCHNFITSHKLDFFVITDTWLSDEDCSSPKDATSGLFCPLQGQNVKWYITALD